jgi:hypothetical protein
LGDDQVRAAEAQTLADYLAEPDEEKAESEEWNVSLAGAYPPEEEEVEEWNSETASEE